MSRIFTIDLEGVEKSKAEKIEAMLKVLHKYVSFAQEKTKRTINVKANLTNHNGLEIYPSGPSIPIFDILFGSHCQNITDIKMRTMYSEGMICQFLYVEYGSEKYHFWIYKEALPKPQVRTKIMHPSTEEEE